MDRNKEGVVAEICGKTAGDFQKTRSPAAAGCNLVFVWLLHQTVFY